MSGNPVHLRRVLGLWDLIFYGIVLIQPIAPVGIFGVAAGISRGHVSTTLVVAMFAMMLTAYSYGQMSILYPAAGSAYTYVGRGLNLHLGFLTGWTMLLDYLIIPVINVIYLALTIQRLAPEVPYFVWVSVTTACLTFLNIQRVRVTARANQAMLAVMNVVIFAFVVLSVRYPFEDNVLAIIGPSTSGETMQIKNLCEEDKMIFVSCAAAEVIVNPVAKYVFKTPQKDSQAVTWIYRTMKESGITNLAILSST